jgi:NAD(P)-dependent dehydrogenase (short-subunit alcohol dehydrogenase family)
MATLGIGAVLYYLVARAHVACSAGAYGTMAENTQLRSKVAIVTGGSRGIGLAIAEALLADGASVVISGLDEEHLKKASRSLAGAGRGEPRLEAVRADMRLRTDVDRLVGRAVDRFGGLDILVNNAGIGVFSPVADLKDDDWQRVLDTNLTGVFYACRAAIPQLRARGGGWIINISSLAGKNAFTGGGAYCASKAALNAFSEVLMQEVRHDGIRVSYVMPGSVATEFSPGGSGADWKLSSGDVAQVVRDLVAHPARSLPSRVEIRPSQPPKK